MMPSGSIGAVAAALALAFLTRADFGPYVNSTPYEAGDFGPWPTETYRSSPIVGPSLNLIESSSLCNDGLYAFLAPRGNAVRTPGPMIVDAQGHLVWTEIYGETFNVNVYGYRGRDYLTFWSGNDGVRGHGVGAYYMLDSSYQEAYKITGANDFPADLHEFHITADETAVFTIYDILQADLRSVDGPEAGWIWDGMFQEVDVESGRLLFQWRASDHIPFTEGYRPLENDDGESQAHPYDFFHINSVDKDEHGNFLVSARYTSSLIYIDGHSGEVLWKLGGKDNHFTDLSDGSATSFAFQHHARFRDNDTAITLFDNAARAGDGNDDGTIITSTSSTFTITSDPSSPPPPSRALYLDINTDAMTVSLRHTYLNTQHPITSQSQGSVQLLPSGNILVGYGWAAAWTEYSISGTPLCHTHFGPETGFPDGNILSYRVSKHAWTGNPLTRPEMIAYAYQAAVSWNGATEVSTWVLQGFTPPANQDEDENDASKTPPDESDLENDHLTFLAAVPKSGFETLLPIPEDTKNQYMRILALNATGSILSTTKFIFWDPTADTAAVSHSNDSNSGMTRSQRRSFLFFVTGFFSAIVLGVGAWAVKRHVRAWIASRGERAVDRERGEWRAVDGFNGDEDLSEGEMSDGIEFSLLQNPRLREFEKYGGYESD